MKDILNRLNEEKCDAYVMYDSADNSDMLYLSGFNASDPYIYIQKNDGSKHLIVASMEMLRARRESACNILSRSDAGMPELLKKYKNADLASAHMITDFAGKRLLVPSSMQVGFAEMLKMAADDIVIDDNTVAMMRSVKNDSEIEKIRDAQKANDAAMKLAVDIIKNSKPDDFGALYTEENVPLTSEFIKEVVHYRFYHMNFDDKDIIISSGADTALPHSKGSGQIYANQPIVMDIFPRSLSTGYFADMTRTVSKGKPSDEIEEMYKTTAEAKKMAAEMIHPGVTGAEVHCAVADFYKSQGYESAGCSGFIHSLGHGVGLDIHEMPLLSPSGGVLEPGNVITIEPGLYYPGIGGVRIEDMGVVTEDGFDIFTCFEEQLIV